ncbi:MAG: hypothetical protein HC888_02790 [Candidatus Competibacteraceae bacterium]|nr:hypothetical protein [Candidatus Competibacteraceae bacterium]
MKAGKLDHENFIFLTCPTIFRVLLLDALTKLAGQAWQRLKIMVIANEITQPFTRIKHNCDYQQQPQMPHGQTTAF